MPEMWTKRDLRMLSNQYLGKLMREASSDCNMSLQKMIDEEMDYRINRAPAYLGVEPIKFY